MRSLIVVEDEELFRKELEAAMPWEDWGFILAGSAPDGLAALELIRSVRPDLVLTDLRMPRLDGIGLIKAISDECPPESRPLVIILSAHSEFEAARSALRLGASDYILKPLEDAELGAALGRALTELEERERRLREDSAWPRIELFGADAERDSRAEHSERDSRTGTGGDSRGARSSHLGYVEMAIEAVREGYIADLSVEELGPRLGITGGHLARLFKARTGITFSEYLARYRIKKAVELLKDPLIRIGEVADLVGYRDQRHFSSLFRKLVGLTPTEFREGRAKRPRPESGT